jgi:hypothetical protein
MVYSGCSSLSLREFERQDLLMFLRDALRQADLNLIPARGPCILTCSDYIYKSFCKGDMYDFDAKEEIFSYDENELGLGETRIYRCAYLGGWIYDVKNW